MSNDLTRVILQNISEKSLKMDKPNKTEIKLQEREEKMIKELIHRKKESILNDSYEAQPSKENRTKYMTLDELVNKNRK